MTTAPRALPYFLDPAHLRLDDAVSFCVSILVAVLVNAEAQAFMATFLGDARSDAKDRFNFNAFLHLDLWGTITFLAAGFGWPRPIKIDAARFKHPRVYTFLTRLAGPVANLLLAGIAGSIVMMMHILTFDPIVFLMLMGVNITTAVYNLIPIPPLAGGALVSALIPAKADRIKWLFNLLGPYFLVAIVLVGRIKGGIIFKSYLDPLVVAVFNFVRG